jgi:hypothetical protein
MRRNALLSLDDEQLAIIKTSAAPLQPWQRDRFLKDVAREIERHSGEIGPGVMARIARMAQRRLLNGSAAKFRRRVD